jgi:two-component system sensor histidine kinase SenX3
LSLSFFSFSPPRSSLDRCRLVAAAKDIELAVALEPQAQVYGDADLLMTAVRNLVDNAVAYSPHSTRVSVAVTRHHGLIEISVTDEGVGIAEDDQVRIFERFYRVDPARSRGTGGTGLGLAIVKHVCANHGGEVTVWSKPGRAPRSPCDCPTRRRPLSRTPTWSCRRSDALSDSSGQRRVRTLRTEEVR